MSNVPATKPVQPIDTLRDLFEKSKKQIAMAVPKHLTADRMVRMAVTAFNTTPGLQECSPLSILACVIKAAELGLELSGPLGQCYLVPRYNKNTKHDEATFQIGYRGLIDLALRSGRVSCFPLRIVYTNDVFQYAYGTKQFIKHIPSEEGPPPIQDAILTYPDNVKAVYAVIYLKGSTKPDFEVMSTAQIEAHRRRFSPKSYSGFSPWQTSWDEMAKKTPARRLAKRSPVSVEFQTAAMIDEYGEAGVPQGIELQLPASEQIIDMKPNSTKTEQLADKLKDRMANGTGARTHEGTGAEEPQQQEEPPPDDPGGLSDEIDEIRGLIADSTTADQLQEAGARLTRAKDRLGPVHDDLVKEYQAKYQSLQPAKAGRQRSTPREF